jgi:N4-gp56 family major capsid protein
MPLSSTFQATVSQYDDYITISDMLDDTSISDEVTAAADELGYRAALTADEILKAEIDSAAGSVDFSLLGTNFSGADAVNVRHQLQGLNIRPKSSDGYFEALIHPYISYDLIKDPDVGGFQDIVKRGTRGNERLFTYEDRGFVAEFGGVRFWESTNVTQVSGSPNKWRTYFFGEGGVSAIDLAGRGPSRVMRYPNSPTASGDRFRLNVVRNLGPSKADPTGKIRAFVSYNFVFVAKIMDSTNYRYRKIDAPSSIVG